METSRTKENRMITNKDFRAAEMTMTKEQRDKLNKSIELFEQAKPKPKLVTKSEEK